MGKEYLVEGAKLICVNGSCMGTLALPEGHGYYSMGRKKANCTDSQPLVNIPCFGNCRMNEKTHQCEGYMKLDKKWVDTVSTGTSPEKVAGEDAISMDSVLLCKKGGVIMPLTSGQGYDEGIDMEAFIRRYFQAMHWMVGGNLKPQVLGKDLMCQIIGKDPINMNTGNFIYEREELVVRGRMPLSFHIFYNSMEEGPSGGLGEGWRHSFEIRLWLGSENGRVTVCRGDGKELPYRRSYGTAYAPVFGGSGMLVREGEGYRYCEGGMEYAFDREGHLLTRRDRDGNMDAFTHDREGRLKAVSGENGGRLEYAYNREGRLIHVSDHTGRKVSLLYRYGKLWKLTTPLGHTYTYEYDGNGKLERVLTPRGIEGVRNEYDSVGRVTRQVTSDGGVVEFRYDDQNRRTYMKEQNGNMVIYESDERFRNVRTIYEDGEEIFKYNDRNQRTLFIDKNGNKTKYRYDSKGNLMEVETTLGNKSVFSYDSEGRLITVGINKQTILSKQYDFRGRLVKFCDALNRKREMYYDTTGYRENICFPDGSQISMEHDDRGNLKRITNQNGVTTAYAYDNLNRVTSILDAEGNTISYEYDAQDRVIRITNPEGNSRWFIYDESLNIITLKDLNQAETTIFYNERKQPERIIDQQGRMTRRSYDQMGNLSEEISPTGVTTIYHYDKNNRLVQISIMEPKKEVPTRVIDYSYDSMENLLTLIVGDGKKVLSETHYEYDAMNRISAIIDAVGGKTVYTYDSFGNITSITDQVNNQRKFTYNNAGELIAETDFDGNITSYTYSVLGKLEKMTDGIGRTTQYIYALGGQLQKIIYPDGGELSYEYNHLGHVSARIDKRGYRFGYNYDCMGRVIKETGSCGEEKRYTYDSRGNILTSTDINDNITQYEYNLENKLTVIIDPLGNKIEYGYDAADHLIQIKQQGLGENEPRIIRACRNALGWIESIEDPQNQKELFTYDALGRMVKKTDKEGYNTCFHYTPDGKLSMVQYGDGSKTEMEYSPLRHLIQIKDWLGNTQIDRDKVGRPIKVTDYNGQEIYYEWGKYGERKTVVYPNERKQTYHYDDLLRLDKFEVLVKGKKVVGTSYRYDSIGGLCERTIENFKTTWSYNSRGLLTEFRHEDRGLVIDRYSYEYDILGNRISLDKERKGLQQESGSYHYHYDALKHLTGVEKNGIMLRNYQYDSYGNRIAMEDHEKDMNYVYTYNSLNQLLSMAINGDAGKTEENYSDKYVYDKRGNLIMQYRDENTWHTYTYNTMNRLSFAMDQRGNSAAYRYNSYGRRIEKNDEKYLLDLTKPYDNMLGIRGKENTQFFYWDMGIAVIEDKKGDFRVYLNDEMGSPLRLMYLTGNGVAYGYDEYGKDLYEPEKENSYVGQGVTQPFGYAGYQYDEISGTYFAQAREYSPIAGRFLAEDIAKSGLNWYTFCQNNPVMYADKNGCEIVLHGTEERKEEFIKEMNKLTDHTLAINVNNNAIYISDYSLDIDHPKGNDLIERTVGNPKFTTDVHIVNNQGSTTNQLGVNGIYQSPNKKGEGANSIIYFNPEVIVEVATEFLDGSDKIVDAKVIPTAIAIGHELIHADRYMRGVGISPNSEVTRKFVYETVPRRFLGIFPYNKKLYKEETVRIDEYATIGLPFDSKLYPDDELVTENDLRAEFNEEGWTHRNEY